MLLPYSTDAPIYHYPVATVSLIVINVIFYFAFCLGIEEKSIADIDHFTDSSGRKVTLEELDAKYQSEKPLGSSETSEAVDYLRGLQPVFRADSIDWRESLMLEYGKIRPWQWVTCMFMHADIGHLIGNMIFLWAFGLVLEGKLGWLLFSGVYLAMGVFQSFAEQVLGYFILQGASLGASGAIFSLLALVLIFAPLNSFETVLLLGRIFFIEVPILVFGGIYLAMNLFFFYASGASYGTEALHLIGFAVGVPVGLIMLTRGYVDCEGYDIISHFTEKKGKDSQVGKQQRRMREKMQRAKEEASLPRTDPVQRKANSLLKSIKRFRKGMWILPWLSSQRSLRTTLDSIGRRINWLK